MLGVREGANAAACKALEDLIERGLASARSLLFVIDGPKTAQGDYRHLRRAGAAPTLSRAQAT